MTKKIIHIVGARPQFIKAAPVSRALRSLGLEETLIHTGQHYDPALSEVFFQTLGIPEPTHNLDVGSGSHGWQTGTMLSRIEEVLIQGRPDLVLVPGDTNSTLAGALAAVKLGIPVGHIESGLRSFNVRMPEEINRRVTDHVSALLFAPTGTALENLKKEGISEGTVWTGDVMYDLFLSAQSAIQEAEQQVLKELDLERRDYVFLTIHRPENTDDPAVWDAIAQDLRELIARLPVVWPVHPRVSDRLKIQAAPGQILLEPQPYVVTQALIRNARVVVTDSGGLQKEAAFNKTPCVTIREQTEWLELVKAGVNHLSPPIRREWCDLAQSVRWPAAGLPQGLYGDGHAAEAVARAIVSFLS